MVPPGNLGARGIKLLRDLTEESVNFSTLAISSISILLLFGELRGSIKEISLIGKKNL